MLRVGVPAELSMRIVQGNAHSVCFLFPSSPPHPMLAVVISTPIHQRANAIIFLTTLCDMTPFTKAENVWRARFLIRFTDGETVRACT